MATLRPMGLTGKNTGRWWKSCRLYTAEMVSPEGRVLSFTILTFIFGAG